jgi:hypothetical protein
VWECNLFCHTEREGHRPRVFENRVLWQIFGSERDEMTEEWRRLHKEEFHGMYCSPNIIRVIKSRRMKSAGHAARMGDRSVVYRGLVERSEVKRPLGIRRRRWEDNIKMGIQKVGWSMDWIDLTQDRDRCRTLVNAVINNLVP